MSRPHLSDDRLIEVCFNLETASGDRAHLEACGACQSRRAALAGTLDDVGTAMASRADEAFPGERLERQRARILQQLDQDGRPGRVIVFPHSQTPHGTGTQSRRPPRWATVGAAVAASFLIGLVAEHLAHDLPGTRQARPAARVMQPADPKGSPTRPQLSDDELLGQVELAAVRVGPAALRPLDAMTPGAWDAR